MRRYSTEDIIWIVQLTLAITGAVLSFVALCMSFVSAFVH